MSSLERLLPLSPATLVWSGKFFHHCTQQQQNTFYLQQGWLVQFVAVTVQQNLGNVLVSLSCNETPRLFKDTSFWVPLMFLLW